MAVENPIPPPAVGAFSQPSGKVIKYRLRFHKSYTAMARKAVEQRLQTVFSALQGKTLPALASDQHLDIELLKNGNARVTLPSGKKIPVSIPSGESSQIEQESTPTVASASTKDPQYRFVPLLEGKPQSSFGAIIKKILSHILPLGPSKSDTIHLGLLQEVLGTYPRDGTVTMGQALDYWIRVIQHDEVPSKETSELVHQLQEAKQLQVEIEKMQRKNLLFDPDSLKMKTRLVARFASKISSLPSPPAQLYIPAGYWKATSAEEGGRMIFQPLLIRVTKEANGNYIFSCPYLQSSITISPEKLPEHLETLLDTLNPRSTIDITNINQNRTVRMMTAPIADKTPITKPLLSAQELKKLYGTPTRVKTKKHAGTYASAVRATKAVVREVLIPPSAPERKSDYKLFRYRHEIDLLEKSAQSKAWEDDLEYQKTIYDSAYKLLMNLTGAREGSTFLESILEADSEKRAAILADEQAKNPALWEIREDVQRLCAIREQIEAHRAEQLKRKGVEKSRPLTGSAVHIPSDPFQRRTVAVGRDSTIDCSFVSTPPTQQEGIKPFLKEASIACEALVRAGEYKALEHLITSVAQALSSFDLDTPPLTIPDAQAIRSSLNTIHRSALAIVVAIPNPPFHPDFLVGLLALEVLQHKALTLEMAAIEIPFYFATALYHELRDQPVAFFRSPKSQALFNTVKRYAESRKPVGTEAASETKEPRINEYRKCVIINHLVAYKNIRFGEKRRGVVDIYTMGHPHYWKEERAAKVDQGALRSQLIGKQLDSLPDLRLNPYKTPLALSFLGISTEEEDLLEEAYIEPYFDMPVMYDVKRPRFCWDRTQSLFESSAPSIPAHSQRDHNPFCEAMVTVAYKTHEYEILERFPDTFNRYSPEEIHAILSLIPQCSQADVTCEQGGPDQGERPILARLLEQLPDTTIHSFLCLLDRFPHLVTDPQCALFIRGAIFKSGILSKADPELTKTLIVRLEECRKRCQDELNVAAEIRLTSLIGAIRFNISPPDEDISADITALKDMKGLSKDEEYIRDQELLALYLLKPSFFPEEQREFFSLYVKTHSAQGRISDVDPGILQEAEQRAFNEIQYIRKQHIRKQPAIIEQILHTCSQLISDEKWNIDHFPLCVRGKEEIDLSLGTLVINGTSVSSLPSTIEETPLFTKLNLQQGLRWTVTEDEGHIKKTYTSTAHPDMTIEADSFGNVRFLKTEEEGGRKTQYVCFDPVYKTQPQTLSVIEMVMGVEGPLFTGVAESASWQITLSEKHRPYVLDNVVFVDTSPTKRKGSRTLRIVRDEMTSIHINLSDKKSSVQLISRGKPPSSLLHVSPGTSDILGRLDERMFATSDGKTTSVYMPLLRFQGESQGVVLHQSDQGVWEVQHEAFKGYRISANLSPIRPSGDNPPIIPPGFTSFMALEKEGQSGTVSKLFIPLVELKPKYLRHVPGQETVGEKSYASFTTEVVVASPGSRPLILLDVDIQDGKPVSSDRTTNAYLAYVALTQHRYADAYAFLEKSRATLPPEQLKKIFEFMLSWPDTSAEGESVKDRVRLIQLGWQDAPSSSAALSREIIKEFTKKLEPDGKAEAFLTQHPIGDITRLQLLLEASGNALAKRLLPVAPVIAPAPEGEERALIGKCIYDSVHLEDFGRSLKLRGKDSVKTLRAAASTMIDEMGAVDKTRKEALIADVGAHCDSLVEERVLADGAPLQEIERDLENKRKILGHQKQFWHNKIIAMCNPSKTGLASLQEALCSKTHKHQIDRILGSYIRGDADLSDLLKEIVPPVDIKELKNLLRQYLEFSVALKHTEDACEKIKKVPQEGHPARQEALDELATFLDATRYVPDRVDEMTSRLLLMLEYSCGFLLRKANVQLVLDLLRNPSCVRQLPPGSGKTKVVLRLLAIMRANGLDLSTIILPEWLYEQNRRDLDMGLREVIGQEAYCLDVPEDRDLSLDELQVMYGSLQATVQNRGVLLTTKTNLLALRNTFEHLERQLCPVQGGAPDPALLEQYHMLSKILDYCKKHMVALCDEVDSILDIHKEVNRKEGGDQDIDPTIQKVGGEFFQVLVKTAVTPTDDPSSPLQQLARAIVNDQQVDLPEDIKKEGLEALVHTIFKDETYATYILKEGAPLPQVPDLATQQRLKVAKTYFQAFQKSTLQKKRNAKDGYGRLGDRVVPYRGPGTPDTNSAFCHPCAIVAYTYQDYIQGGIRLDQAETLYAEILRLSKSQKEEDRKHLLDLCTDFEIDQNELSKLIDENKAIKYVLDQINSSATAKFAYCVRYCIPKLKTSGEQVKSNAFDLVDMMKSFAGMTGTPHNVTTYSDKITEKEKAVTLGSDGSTLVAVAKLATAGKMQIVTLKSAEPDAVLAHVGKTYQGVIDIGAYLTSLSAEEIAQKMGKGMPKDSPTLYILYVDSRGQYMAYDIKKDQHVPYDDKNTAMSPGNCKTIFQSFVGTDIKQTRDAKFLVTIGNMMGMKDFIQGVMRLRNLGKDQTFDIALSPEVADTIRKSTDKQSDEILTISDILTYCELNYEQEAKDAALASERTKIQRVPEALLFEDRVERGVCVSPEELQARRTAYRDIVASRSRFDADSLQTETEEVTSKKALDDATALASRGLEQLEILPQAKREEGLRILRERRTPREDEMPQTAVGVDFSMTAVAQAQQQTKQTQQMHTRSLKTALGAACPKWMPKAIDELIISHCNLSLFVSPNILRGWKSKYFVPAQYAIFINGNFHIVDQTEFQRFSSIEKAVKISFGSKTCIQGTLQEKDVQKFYRCLVTAKLLAGYVDFHDPNHYLDPHNQKEKIALAWVINEQKRNLLRQKLEASEDFDALDALDAEDKKLDSEKIDEPTSEEINEFGQILFIDLLQR